MLSQFLGAMSDKGLCCSGVLHWARYFACCLRVQIINRVCGSQLFVFHLRWKEVPPCQVSPCSCCQHLFSNKGQVTLLQPFAMLFHQSFQNISTQVESCLQSSGHITVLHIGHHLELLIAGLQFPEEDQNVVCNFWEFLKCSYQIIFLMKVLSIQLQKSQELARKCHKLVCILLESSFYWMQIIH